MADATYPNSGTGIYRTQGGNEVVVGTTGRVTGNSSDNWTMTHDRLTFGTSGYLQHAVSAASTATAITNNGVSTVTATTAAGANAYTISDPVAGVIKYITGSGAINSSDHAVIVASTDVTFAPGNTKNRLKVIQAAGVVLFGVSTTAWSVATSTTIAFATS